jgi:phage shock protein A
MREFLVRLLDLLGSLQGRAVSPMASLDRSIAAAGHAHSSARRALAVAMAEETRDTDRRAGLSARIADLEARALEALRAGREDLAAQASQAIASMATEINASERASQRFAAEVALARREVDAQRRRLAELDRGRRLARIGNALTATTRSSHSRLDSFTDAEIALAQIVADNQDARAVREEMAPTAEHLIERMSDSGFGEPVHVRAGDVLNRLRALAATSQNASLIESSTHSQ